MTGAPREAGVRFCSPGRGGPSLAGVWQHEAFRRNAGALALFGATLFCAFLMGRMDSVGQAPWFAVGLHLTLLGLAVLAARALPVSALLLLALLARLCFLPMEPAGDVNRYAWEGHVQVLGENPYQSSPDDLSALAAAGPDSIAEIHAKVNHKDKTAIYPPGAQALLHLTAFAAWPNGDTRTYKWLALAADWATVLVLVVLLLRLGRDPRWAALYAINPVVLWSFAGEGHIDSFMLLGLALALLAWQTRAWVWMFLALALAFHIKYMAVFVFPFFVCRRSWRWLWVLALGVLLPFALYGPPFAPIFDTLRVFSRDFHYNGALHPILNLVFGEAWLASRAGAVLALIGVLVIRLFNGHPLEGGAWAMGWVLLCAPTVHIWYLCWVVVFLPFRPSLAWLLVCGGIAATYFNVAIWWETDEWQPMRWLGLLVWIPWLLGAWIQRFRCRPVAGLAACKLEPASTSHCFFQWASSLCMATESRRFLANFWPSRTLYDDRPQRVPTADPANGLVGCLPRVESVSVIVPTLNEAGHLDGFFEKLSWSRTPVHEVIVADAGSTDATCAIARRHGALVLEDVPKGRGRQMHRAAQRASGDVILLAHADMEIDPTVIERILAELNRSGKVGGAVGCSFGRSPGMRQRFLLWLGLLNRVRAGWGGIAFGDQGQFVRRDWLERTGGVPDQFLMEDVELSLRLKEHEAPLYLNGGITASPRTWGDAKARGRRFGRAFGIVVLVARYMIQRVLLGRAPDTRSYFERYYGA